jgi:hypothetical protein
MENVATDTDYLKFQGLEAGPAATGITFASLA